jgi:DNA-binding GntR family transcriptional regulator
MDIETLEAEEPERTLLSEQIRKALTDEITAGVLLPGQALDEQQLASRFGASRTPVREALRQLSTSGLVEIRPRRGVFVTRLSPERMMEMFETAAEMEALCVRLATYRMTPLERAHIVALHQASQVMVEASDVDAYDRFNHSFHILLYRGTHNAFLCDYAAGLRDRLDALRRTQLRQPGRMQTSTREHADILAAMAEGDGDLAARRMRAHLLNAAVAFARFAADHTPGGSEGLTP